MYQLQTRLTDVLNFPLFDRVRQLQICIETAPIKDLEAFYPALVSSIFGFHETPGWGLRTVTEKNFNEFKILYEFFHPHSSFFQLIYRLLKDSIKYDVKLTELPVKLRQIIESGRYGNFYTNLVNTDNFQPRCMALSLNAFDFFIFHFAIHGMKNFHKSSPAATAVNNENLKTVYFNLAADFLCNFLPSDPNGVVFPQIDCSPVKSHSTSMPLPTNSSPMKQPKYLMLSALTHQIQTPNPNTTRTDLRLPENARSSNWRSESVLNIFIDCWLRYDVDEWELPGNEFVRLVRILVKQLHFFGNVAEQDLSAMSHLRSQAQALLNVRIYPFLKSIMARWPLDTSFLNPLECWLSYIQPWRYIYNRNVANLNNEVMEIPERFKSFISENLVSYTQIFVRLIPRFLKMDLSLNKNALMLFRMVKVFRQPSDFLREIERQMMNNGSTHVRSNNSSFNDNSIHSSPPRSQTSFNRSSPHPHHRSHNQSGIDDSNYIFMFGEDVTLQIYELMQRLYLGKLKTTKDVDKMEREMHRHTTTWEKFMQFIGWISSLSLSFSMALEEKKKTPAYLDFCLNSLSPVFGISIEDATRDFEEQDHLDEESDDEHLAMRSGSDVLNITPSFMKQQLKNVSYSGDPFLLPIMDSEVKFLVRFLHQVSAKLNEMFEPKFQNLWNRPDFYGKFSRQILSPPVETRLFDKSAGYSELKVKQIGPRISLRVFASRKMLMLLVFCFLFGRIFLGASSLGFITFSMIAFGYLVIKAAIST